MKVEDGNLMVMVDFGMVKGERYILYSSMPTLRFYSVFGPDFHMPPEAK